MREKASGTLPSQHLHAEQTGPALVAAVQAKGSDATDARDAAHEACHALEWGVSKRWTRDNIHARKPKRPGDGLRSEILARAVEAIVCGDFGIEHNVDKWAMICWMEMLKNERVELPTDLLPGAIRHAMTSKHARAMADRVLSLCSAGRGRLGKEPKSESVSAPRGPKEVP